MEEIEEGNKRKENNNDVKFIHDPVMRRQLVRTSCEFLSGTKDVLTQHLCISMAYFRLHTYQTISTFLRLVFEMMVMKTRGFTALVCVFLTLLCCRSVDGFQTVRSHNKLLPTFTPPHSHRQGLRIRDTKMHNSNYNYNFNNNNRRNVDDPEFQVLFPTVNEFDLPRILTLSFPAFIFLFAFSTYKETSLAFHNFVNAVSGNTWLPADGGKSLTDLITPALNGPVTTVISLLFGTLVSTTIGNLYNRQNELSCLLATMFDDIRLAEIHAEFFPEPYGRRASQLLQDFTISIIEDYDVNQGDFEAEVDKLRDRRELGMLIYLFHEMEADPNVNVPGGALGESYGTVNKIIAARSDLIATYNNCFPPWYVPTLHLFTI